MWRSKKAVLMMLLAVALLAGSVAGIAAAQDENATEDKYIDKQGELLDRVCVIYEANTGVAIDAEQLQEAFIQAQDEIAAAAMENRLQALVDEGIITQEQADEYLDWWQARPDTVLPGPNGRGFGHGGCGGGMHFGQWPKW